MSQRTSIMQGHRPSIQYSLNILNYTNPGKFRMGTNALRAGDSQGSVGSNFSYESGGSQGVKMGRRKFNVKTADTGPPKKLMKIENLKIADFDGGEVFKASFDLGGVTESLEKGSRSIKKNFDGNINQKDFSDSKNQNIMLEQVDITDESWQQNNKKDPDDISQENPLNGYIIFENTQSKDQILSQNSKEIAQNPLLQTKFLNSSEPSNQHILNGGDVQKSHELREMGQKLNQQLMNERLGALSATNNRQILNQSPRVPDKTDQTEKTFPKEASFDGQVDFSIYSTKKNSEENFKILSPHLYSNEHYIVPITEDRNSQMQTSSFMNTRKLQSKFRNSELKQSLHVHQIPPVIISSAQNKDRSNSNNSPSYPNKFVNLPVKQLELSENSRFESRLHEAQMLIDSQQRSRRSGQSSTMNNNNLNNQQVVNNLQKANKLVTIKQSKMQMQQQWPPILPQSRIKVKKKTKVNSPLTINNTRSSIQNPQIQLSKIASSTTPRKLQNVDLNRQIASMNSKGSLNFNQGSIMQSGKVQTVLGQSTSRRSKQNHTQSNDSGSALDGVFNVQKLEPIMVPTQYMPHIQQLFQKTSGSRSIDKNSPGKLPQIRASISSVQQNHLMQSTPYMEFLNQSNKAQNEQRILQILNNENQSLQPQEKIQQKSKIDYNLMNSPITKYCVMYIQKNNSSQIEKNKSPSEMQHTLLEKDGRKSTLSSLSRHRKSGFNQNNIDPEQAQSTTLEQAPKTQFQTFSVGSTSKKSFNQNKAEKSEKAGDNVSEICKNDILNDHQPVYDELSQNNGQSVETPKDTQNWVMIPNFPINSLTQYPMVIQSNQFGVTQYPKIGERQILLQKRGHEEIINNHLKQIEYLQSISALHGLYNFQDPRFFREETLNSTTNTISQKTNKAKNIGKQQKNKHPQLSMTQILNKLNKRITTEKSNSLIPLGSSRHTRNQINKFMSTNQDGNNARGNKAIHNTLIPNSQIRNSSNNNQNDIQSSQVQFAGCESGRVSLRESSLPMNAETKSFFSFNRKIMNLDFRKSKHLSNFSMESIPDKIYNDQNDYIQNMNKSKLTAVNSIHASKQVNMNSPLSNYCTSVNNVMPRQDVNRIRLNLPSQKEMPLIDQQNRGRNNGLGMKITNITDYEDSVPSTTHDKMRNDQDTNIRNSIENSKSSLEHPLNIGIQQIRVIENQDQVQSPEQVQNQNQSKLINIIQQQSTPKNIAEKSSIENTENSYFNSPYGRGSPLPTALRQKYSSTVRGDSFDIANTEMRIERLRQKLTTGSPNNKRKQKNDSSNASQPISVLNSNVDKQKGNLSGKNQKQLTSLVQDQIKNLNTSSMAQVDVIEKKKDKSLVIDIKSASNYGGGEARFYNHIRAINKRQYPLLENVLKSTLTPIQLQQNEKKRLQGLVVMNHNSKLICGPVYDEAKLKKNMKTRTIQGIQQFKSKKQGNKRTLSIFLQKNSNEKKQATRLNTELGTMTIVGKQQDISGKLDSSHTSNYLKPYNDSTQNIQISREKLNSIRALSEDSEDSKCIYEESYLVKTINNSTSFKNQSNQQFKLPEQLKDDSQSNEQLIQSKEKLNTEK